MSTDEVLSDKDAARESLLMILKYQTLPAGLEGQIKLIQLYITAGEPIPANLHKAVSQACDALIKSEKLTKPVKDDKVYNLIYNIHLWSLLNKKEGSNRPLEDAYDSAEEFYDNPYVRDIYKASAKSYNIRSKLAQQAKNDAKEEFEHQNWGFSIKDKL